MTDILVFREKRNDKDIFNVFPKPFSKEDYFSSFIRELSLYFCETTRTAHKFTKTHIVKSFYYIDSSMDRVIVESDIEFQLFISDSLKKKDSENIQQIWLEYSPKDVSNSISSNRIKTVDLMIGTEFQNTTRKEICTSDSLATFKNMIQYYSQEKKLVENFNSSKVEIVLILDTNVFAGYNLEYLEKFIKNEKISLHLPYIIFRELDDFKDNRKSSQDGEIMRYVGRRSINLINKYLQTKIFVGTDKQMVEWNLPHTPTKDDIILRCVKWYENDISLSSKEICLVSKDEGVIVRIKSQTKRVRVFSSMEGFTEYLQAKSGF